MVETDRRTILRALMGGTAAAVALPESISRALAIPANTATGTIRDVEHIVILMQENRSFDHYFGTLRGVRGFSDPRQVTLPSGNPVIYQPNSTNTGYVLPYHPTLTNLGLQFLGDLAHSWSDAHGAWNNGKYDMWVKNKGTESLAYMERSDIPFHYALADAFTICDAYHCSTMTSTDPNRYYMWTGWVGNNGTGVAPQGPVIANTEAGYSWSTYPELLNSAGVSWKIYQDIGTGLNKAGAWGWTSTKPYIGNYGDNSLLYFLNYQNAVAGSDLYQKARTGTNVYNGGAYNGGTFFDILRQDVMNNTLPQVSWVVAPEAYSEHPNWPANYGAWYVSNVLSVLTSNPAVWSKTVFIINFDENDGFFDHVVPPTPPSTAAPGASTVSIANEIYSGTGGTTGPYGLGARVPMLIVSPWSKGGWVCSQVFDHTSVIQFIEQRFGLDYPGLITESNITPWRRAVCGDLTAAFDFTNPNALSSHLPSTTTYVPPQSDITNSTRHSNASVAPPANQVLPVQESGLRLARALPYQLQATAQVNLAAGTLGITFVNTGTVGAFFHIRSGLSATGPWAYTVEAGKSLAGSWSITGATTYDFNVFGANGFFRRFQGKSAAGSGNLTVTTAYDAAGGITLTVTNAGSGSTQVSIVDKYTGTTAQQILAPAASFQSHWALTASYSWYDLTVTMNTDSAFSCHLAGHVETGASSVSDPLLGLA